MKYVIIGGVAAGASAAARLRRLDEASEITLLERGETISYANCGLPYHVGGVIAERARLTVMPPEKFSAWFNVDVRVRTRATSIDRAAKTVAASGPDGDCVFAYDKLLIATGATPADGAVSGGGGSRVTNLWTIADMDRVIGRLDAGAKSAIVAGAGFIGLEAAENLRRRGLAVTIVQRGGHVLPSLDAEMASPLAAELAVLGVDVRFGRTVAAWREYGDSVEAVLDDGGRIGADMAIVATGVRPASDLARDAGLELGPQGHIAVDERLRTSDASIFAAGDVIEVTEPVFGGRTAIALAGPANKQGRIAADNMAGGDSVYRGTFGASVVKVGSLTAASVGFTETRLKTAGRNFRKIYVHPSSGAGYYPGAARLSVKLLFGDGGEIYGAQIVGAKGVDKRIDTIAVAMRAGMKAPRLGELELAYAPPYSSAKDPVNFCGFVAENVLTGKSDVVSADAIPESALVVDVREPAEYELGAIPGAVNVPLGELRSRLGELDSARQVITCCQVGLRGYLAERILKQHGFKAANISGGYLTWKLFHPDPPPRPAQAAPAALAPSCAAKVLDVRQLPCPGPVVKLKAAFGSAAPGEAVKLLADASFEPDLARWCESNGCRASVLSRRDGTIEALVAKGGGAAPPPPAANGDSAAIVLFSGDYDKAMAAMILANGFVAAGMKVGVFFTFWGLAALRRNPAPPAKKKLVEKLFGWMLPCGAEKLALSKMNMLGMGAAMMKRVMKTKRIMSLSELIRSAREAGVRFIACDMAMGVMGFTRDDLIEVDEVAGVASFAELAGRSSTTLFI
ncbi:MAG: FAD-dependent oxidoreductase [Kiritimatiellae bacterium]|nr:FAD-dependent oxidoreductase [Kiritimatiellia bacterium]